MNLHLTVLLSTAILAFLPGCGHEPAMLNSEGTNADGETKNAIHWKQSDVSGWRYELESVDKVKIYSFMPLGHVVATISGHDPGGAMALAGPVFHWRIDANGKLLIADRPNDENTTALVLLELDNGMASVWNERQSKVERYARKRND